MVVQIEVSRPAIWKFGKFRSTLGGRPYKRYWFGWFAVAWWPGDAKEYGDAIRDGVWIDQTRLTRSRR